MNQIRILLISTILFLNFNLLGQQRIGLDVSSRLDNLMFTAHFQKVLKNRWIYSVGVYIGSHGHVLVENDTMRLYAGESIQTPFSEVNRPIKDSVTTYAILDYFSSARSGGIQGGIGYFFEFDSKHGLRMNLNATLGFVNSKLSGYHRSTETFSEIRATHFQQHFVGSISLEAFHTIRLTGRLTFNYGLKVPYYFTVDKAKFNPTTTKDLMYGFEPQLSMGLTRVIGKCD